MLTRKRKINFKQLVDVKLPKAKRIKATRSESQLYDIEVIEDDPSTQRMKIHYIGYSSRYNEWRPASDIVDKRTLVMNEDSTSLRLHAELALRIKSNLSSSRKNSPEVRIEIPSDKDLYNSTSGLKSKGREVKIIRGIMHYSFASYSDLVPILGKNWYIRGFNEAGDCCYVLLERVRFFLWQRRHLVEYIPDTGCEDKTLKKIEKEQGYLLVFTFVRGDGLHTDLYNMYQQ